jgi:hypothetical protein
MRDATLPLDRSTSQASLSFKSMTWLRWGHHASVTFGSVRQLQSWIAELGESGT